MIYKAELERLNVSTWASRDLRALLLDKTSTYAFDATDVFVDDAMSAGGVEGGWLQGRVVLTLSTPTFSTPWWQLPASSIDWGLIGTGAGDETAGMLIYEHVTDDTDSLLVCHMEASPTVDVWDGTNPFTVTFSGGWIMRVGE